MLSDPSDHIKAPFHYKNPPLIGIPPLRRDIVVGGGSNIGPLHISHHSLLPRCDIAITSEAISLSGAFLPHISIYPAYLRFYRLLPFIVKLKFFHKNISLMLNPALPQYFPSIAISHRKHICI